MTWWPRWLSGSRRRRGSARATEAHRRADEAVRDAHNGRAEAARIADSLERRASRNAFGEAMIELFRGHAGGRP